MMKPDRLDQISKLYHEVVARDENERRVFLSEACAGNESLRQEVEALLKYDDAAARFIEMPALVVAAQGFGNTNRQPSDMTGRQIGAFRILSLVGHGGMGDVYRATDSRLGRDVAIKFLPQAFVADPARRARFEREARLLAALNHPNIAQVHGLEESDGVQALVMELVPGKTLAEMISSRSVSPGSVLSIARQMAEAIDAAHERGILHRDLKPANIKVTPDGVVKVLDFGLARTFAIDPLRVVSGESPDAAHTGTADGIIMGTAGYMSPEQARGLPVDKRTDVWAFGCTLYELLAGRPAFDGPTLTDTLAAILQHEPDWNALPPTVSPHLRELLQRCLAKDPKRRLRDIGDARFELDSLQSANLQAAVPVASRTHERVWMAVAVVAALAAAGAIGWRLFSPLPAPDSVSFTVSPPENHVLGAFAISPDGRQLAFVAATDKSRLWVRALDSLAPRPLAGTEGAVSPVWAPDSLSLAFIDSSGAAFGRLKRVDLTGGAPTTVAEFVHSASAWNDAGVILLQGRDGRLYRVSERGGDPVAVAELDRSRQENSLLQPIFLPDGRRFIFRTFNQDPSKQAFFLGSLDSPSRTHLLDGLTSRSGPFQPSVAYAGGHLFYERNGTLMAHRFDERVGRLIGDAVPVIENILVGQRGVVAFSIARNGTVAYRTAEGVPATLTWFDREGRSVTTVGGDGSYENPQLSPDGRWLAVCRKDQGQHDIWIVDLERNIASPLTSDPAADDYPVWSADGKHVIFASNRRGHDDLYWRAADGSGADELLFASREIKRPTSVGPDGTLLFSVRTGPGQDSLDVWGLPLAGDRKPFPVISSATANEYNAVFSRDGHWIVYQRGEGGGVTQIYLQPFPSTGKRIRVSTDRGGFPRWSGDGSQIFFCTGASLAVADVSSPGHPGVPRTLFPWRWFNVWTADGAGQQFLRPVSAEADAQPPITVVLHWTAELPPK